MIKIEKIQLNNFRFFIDEEENNTFEPNEKGLLVYGENGSGKSSLFKAFELLAKVSKVDISDEFRENKNLFNLEQDSEIKFEFDNNNSLDINDDTKIDSNYDFIDEIYLTNSLLDYKKLLQINFMKEQGYSKINLYHILNRLFEYYPIGDDKILLKDIENPNDQLNELKNILDNLLDGINLFLEKFTTEFKIEKFIYTTDYIPLAKGLGLNNALEFVINIEINFKDNIIEKHHDFLNEAKLSSLAMAIYFTIIKHLSSLDINESLKILVLDDLLISLDMSNRLNLIDILKSEFSDFQIFFFTHEKAFFEVLKDKMSWKAYEIYVNKSEEGFEVPYVKKSLNHFESAKKHFEAFDYPASANYLRKEVERLKKIKERQEASINQELKIFKKMKKMLLSSDLSDSNRVKSKLIGFKQGLEEENNSHVEIDLRNIKGITDRILNPQSHDDMSRPLYKKELEEAMEIIEGIRGNI